MIGVILWCLFIFEAFAIDLTTAKECVTPYNEIGSCVPITSCDVVLSVLVTLTPEGIQFANDSKCGCDEEMVCCGTTNVNNKPYPQFINCLPVPPPNIFPSPMSDSSVCGLHLKSKYVAGGTLVKEGEFPWIAALEYTNTFTNENAGFRCGGSLINKRFILTAAHCIMDEEFKIIKVWLGATNITSQEICSYINRKLECIKTGEKLDVAKTFVHELYNGNDKLNDIGLLQLDADVKFSYYIRPICLPSRLSILPSIGTGLTVAGWGRSENGTQPQVKLKVTLPLKDNRVCRDYLKKYFLNVTSQQLCVGGEIRRDSCDGDSGAPLMYDFIGSNGEVRWYQEGIVSYGTGCGVKEKPGIYTEVSSYSHWIYSKIEGELGEAQPCTTQNGTTGLCALLKICQEISNITLTESASDENQCGTTLDKANPLVCCENPSFMVSGNSNTTSATLPDETTCGIYKQEPGIEDDPLNIPWMVGIEVSFGQTKSTKIKCVGVVVHSRYVLTSGDCVSGGNKENFDPINVWLGQWNSTKVNANPVQKIRIKKIIPNRRSIISDYNNALILLENEIKFSDYINPICVYWRHLPNINAGENVTVVRISNSSSRNITSSDMILKEELPLINCSNSLTNTDRSRYCIAGTGKEKSFATSAMLLKGTPFIMRRYNDKQSGRMQWYLVTATVWGDTNIGNVEFYTDGIDDQLDWIKTTISENS